VHVANMWRPHFTRTGPPRSQERLPARRTWQVPTTTRALPADISTALLPMRCHTLVPRAPHLHSRDRRPPVRPFRSACEQYPRDPPVAQSAVLRGLRQRGTCPPRYGCRRARRRSDAPGIAARAGKSLSAARPDADGRTVRGCRHQCRSVDFDHVALAVEGAHLVEHRHKPRLAPLARLERNRNLFVEVCVALEQVLWRPAVVPEVVERARAALGDIDVFQHARELVRKEQVHTQPMCLTHLTCKLGASLARRPCCARQMERSTYSQSTSASSWSVH
jgi:hypothetical protein